MVLGRGIGGRCDDRGMARAVVRAVAAANAELGRGVGLLVEREGEAPRLVAVLGPEEARQLADELRARADAAEGRR